MEILHVIQCLVVLGRIKKDIQPVIVMHHVDGAVKE